MIGESPAAQILNHHCLRVGTRTATHAAPLMFNKHAGALEAPQPAKQVAHQLDFFRRARRRLVVSAVRCWHMQQNNREDGV